MTTRELDCIDDARDPMEAGNVTGRRLLTVDDEGKTAETAGDLYCYVCALRGVAKLSDVSRWDGTYCRADEPPDPRAEGGA